jgi:hypothetical protein
MARCDGFVLHDSHLCTVFRETPTFLAIFPRVQPFLVRQKLSISVSLSMLTMLSNTGGNRCQALVTDLRENFIECGRIKTILKH